MRSNLASIGPEGRFARGAPATAGSGPWQCQGGCGRTGGAAAVTHPLQPPAGASGARFAGYCLRLRAGWVPGIALPLPTRIPHPGTIPSPYTTPCMACSSVLLCPRACTYGCFWTRVGEPRGPEYSQLSGSQAGYIQYLVFWEVCTAV